MKNSKKCTKCKNEIPLKMFSPRKESSDGLIAWCKPCRNVYLKQWSYKNREKVRASANKHYRLHRDEKLKRQKQFRDTHKEQIVIKNKLYNRKIREKVISHYSKGKAICACCKEAIYEFLSIDHINGGGANHRRKIAKIGYSFYLWLIKNNFPKGFQVLCHNCNMAKGLYGGCPHSKK